MTVGWAMAAAELASANAVINCGIGGLYIRGAVAVCVVLVVFEGPTFISHRNPILDFLYVLV